MCIRDSSDAEALTTQGHLNGIFQLIEEMQAVDTRGVEPMAVSYTHLRAHETVLDLVCRLLLEKKTRERPQRE